MRAFQWHCKIAWTIFYLGFIGEMFAPENVTLFCYCLAYCNEPMLISHTSKLCTLRFCLCVYWTNYHKIFPIVIFVVKTGNIVQYVFINRHKTNILSNKYKHILWYSLGTRNITTYRVKNYLSFMWKKKKIGKWRKEHITSEVKIMQRSLQTDKSILNFSIEIQTISLMNICISFILWVLQIYIFCELQFNWNVQSYSLTVVYA